APERDDLRAGCLGPRAVQYWLVSAQWTVADRGARSVQPRSNHRIQNGGASGMGRLQGLVATLRSTVWRPAGPECVDGARSAGAEQGAAQAERVELRVEHPARDSTHLLARPGMATLRAVPGKHP